MGDEQGQGSKERSCEPGRQVRTGSSVLVRQAGGNEKLQYSEG